MTNKLSDPDLRFVHWPMTSFMYLMHELGPFNYARQDCARCIRILIIY